jgi:hypothetical protein
MSTHTPITLDETAVVLIPGRIRVGPAPAPDGAPAICIVLDTYVGRFHVLLADGGARELAEALVNVADDIPPPPEPAPELARRLVLPSPRHMRANGRGRG